ncbi:MAG: histidine kinase [Bacteroidia bacterium]
MQQYRIIHIEDSPADIELVKRVLKKSGLQFEYCVVADNEQFVQQILNFTPNVILCDHTLPSFDSIRAFETYTEMNLEVAFILVTGSVSEEYAVEMMHKGIDDYLLKDNLQRLPNAIENAFTKREKEHLRKIAEKKLAQTAALLNKAQQLAHIGSLEVNLETNTELWSKELFRIFGLVPDEITPSLEAKLSFIHPEDLSFVKSNLEQARKYFQDMSFYCRIIRKDKKERHIRFECKFEFSNNIPVKLHGIIHDITEKVLAEAEKEFEQKNMSALINNTNDLIWSVDKNFNLITSNYAFDHVLSAINGKRIEKGQSIFSNTFEKERLTNWKKNYARALSGESFTVIEEYKNSWSEISFHPIRQGISVIGTACYSRDITEFKNHEREILEKNTQLKNLTSHLQHIREEERTNIAREIHDELGQQLTALKMDIDWVLHKQGDGNEAAAKKLNEMLSASDVLISTIRRISSDLRPAIIDDLGLVAALEWKCTDFEEKMGIPCKFISTVKERKFENNFGINAFRILQETLTNVGRHSKAKSVTVSVSENEHELLLEIADDGKGISPENIQNGKTLGIIGMKERAALLGGKLFIEGTKNKGTRTKLILPFKNEYSNS